MVGRISRSKVVALIENSIPTVRRKPRVNTRTATRLRVECRGARAIFEIIEEASVATRRDFPENETENGIASSPGITNIFGKHRMQ